MSEAEKNKEDQVEEVLSKMFGSLLGTEDSAKEVDSKGAPGSAILTKLSRIMGSLNGLRKDKKNSHHGFKFVSHDQVMKGVRRAFIEEGIVFLPAITSVEKKGNSAIVHMTFTYFDSESGESFASSWVGEGQDSQDKGVYKAITQCVKTQLLKLLLIPSGDEFNDGDFGIGYGKDGKDKNDANKASAPASTPKNKDDVKAQIKAKIKELGWKAPQAKALAQELEMPVSRSWPNFDKFTNKQAVEYLLSLEKAE